MKHVYTHDNIMVLNSAKNILAQHGIESVVKNEHIANINAQHGINNAFHELWILNDQEFDRAAGIIEKEVKNPEPAAAWICGGCEEQNEGSFDFCWNCQKEKPGEAEN